MSKSKRKGDGLLGFGIIGIILGIILLGAPIGIPLLLIGLVCLVAWFFVRNQDNADRRHKETLEALKSQLAEERKHNQG